MDEDSLNNVRKSLLTFAETMTTFKYLVTGTVKETLQYYENITHDFRYDSLTLTPCIC